MTHDDDRRPGEHPGEYPDRAGYPDGEGTLDEGTGAYRGPDRDEVDDIDDFAMGDEEDVEDV
jgi:hypothetical protein